MTKILPSEERIGAWLSYSNKRIEPGNGPSDTWPLFFSAAAICLSRYGKISSPNHFYAPLRLLWISPTETPRNEDPFGPDGSMNSHVYTLKNGNQVRMVGHIIKNGSNIHDAIVRHEVEYNAWRYNYCYDGSFGHLNAGTPQGSVVITFEVLDQLPQHERIDQSDFSDDGFNKCVLGTLRGQTFNEAGSKGTGQVTYAFRFLPK